MRLIRATRRSGTVALLSAARAGNTPDGGALRLIRATRRSGTVALLSASRPGKPVSMLQLLT
ncbi:hypothetical protein DMS95_09155 [Klebsiella variicola]|nr:hypothetical protein DMS95_09155 [Klebsiella variicola]